jgi:hypothetical protein
MSPYDEAHLIVAAIRILHHQKKSPPTIEDLSTLLGISVEAGLADCRTYEKKGILDIAEDPFSIKLGIADHLKIEELSRDAEDENRLAAELEQFMNKKQDFNKKVDAIKAELEQKRKSLHNDIEEKLKKEMKNLKGGS